MSKIKQVIRLRRSGTSVQTIAQVVQSSRNTVKKYLRLIDAGQHNEEELLLMADDALVALLNGPPADEEARVRTLTDMALALPSAAALQSHTGAPQARLSGAGPGFSGSDLQALKDKDPEARKLDRPRAYLNYVFFDKQLNFVEEGSGVKQLQGDPGQLETLASGKVVARKSGYVYVFTSNESTQDVLFDNLGVTQITGPVLEETHYYPFGLTMAEISSTAPLKLENRFKYNGKELQNKEFSDGSELEWYDYGARMYDLQLGRWKIIDPLAEKYSTLSPYAFVANNPLIYIDPNGREIIGATKRDAQDFRQDIYKVLADKKFDNVRGLINIKGKRFSHLDATALSKALDGVDLTKDERAYIDVVTNTINSKEKQVVEYLSYGDDASSSGSAAAKDYFISKDLPVSLLMTPEGELKASVISALGGEGFNVPTKNGSYSFIISGVPNGKNTERAVTSGHEVLGHSIPSSRGMTDAENNSNAIRMDNLVRRLLELPQRDGSDHAGYHQGQITDPYKLPITQ